MKEKKGQIKNSKADKFKYRKAVHYTLITSVIFLQLILLIILYNEIFNEPKLRELEAELHISEQAQHFSDLTKDDYISAQNNLQNYIHTKEDKYLLAYNDALTSLSKNIENLEKTAGKSDLFSLYLKKDNNSDISVKKINSKIDSLRRIEFIPNPPFNDNAFKLKAIKYDDILDSVNIETTFSVDSVQRKGLLSRVSSAIAGKVDVQKEKSNVVLTLRKGSNVNSGSIEEQLKYLFKNTNDYYQKEFQNYKKQYNKQLAAVKKNDTGFFDTNKELLNYSNLLLKKYNNALVSFTNDARLKFQEQYQTNKQIRNYAIIGVIFFMVLISVILAFITSLTFAYEKRLIQAQKKIEQNLNFKNRIVGMISHEIRSPLNIISIYSQGIRRQIQDQEVQESLKSIEFTTHSLSLLANQILDLSKNENKKMALNKTTFNLKYELDEVLKSLSSFVEINENKLLINNSITEDVMIHSDVVKIHQLFYNIVGNANKFTKKGQISVDVSLEKSAKNTQRLLVEVKDNGAGINEEDLKHIFDSYHQGEISAEVKNLGAGLGLNLCKEIIELFNGKIRVTSKQNEETIVTFDLILDAPEK